MNYFSILYLISNLFRDFIVLVFIGIGGVLFDF